MSRIPALYSIPPAAMDAQPKSTWLKRQVFILSLCYSGWSCKRQGNGNRKGNFHTRFRLPAFAVIFVHGCSCMRPAPHASFILSCISCARCRVAARSGATLTAIGSSVYLYGGLVRTHYPAWQYYLASRRCFPVTEHQIAVAWLPQENGWTTKARPQAASAWQQPYAGLWPLPAS